MDIYPLLKDIIIPFLSPLIAIIVLLLFIRLETKKIELKNKDDTKLIVKSIYIDLLYLREQWQLLGLEKVGQESKKCRTLVVKEIYSRIKKNIFERPEIYDGYFKTIPLKVKDNKIFLLLGELDCDFQKDEIEYNDYVLYAIYKLLRYFEAEKEKIQEIEQIVEMLEQSRNDDRIKEISSIL